MPTRENKFQDYQTLSPKNKNNGGNGSISSVHRNSENISSLKKSNNINAPLFADEPLTLTSKGFIEKKQDDFTEPIAEEIKPIIQAEPKSSKKIEEFTNPLSYAEQQKFAKKQKAQEKDQKLLSKDTWLKKNGHNLTFVGIFIFTIFVLFRPYELIPALSFLSTSAFYIAVATLLIYIPTQISTEGNFTNLSTEVKCIIFITVWSLLTMPIAKDPKMSWDVFNDTFSKAVVIFIVMVNVLRTEERLKKMMWISLAVAMWLSYTTITLFLNGEAKIEGYRVDANVQGLFGNPNDLSLHLVTMIPIALTLAIGAKSRAIKAFLFGLVVLFLSANLFTYSRGGFLGLIGATLVLAWKIGRNARFKTMLVTAFFGLIVLLVAPGGFGLRILSIFIPGLDPVGSSDERSELLKQSLIVTLRNPWGIGLGNFPIVSSRNLQTHNAYTQVSSELGILAFIALLIFLISPIRKLGAIERTLYDKGEFSWLYYLSIGMQASLVAYMISSFFGPVAYNWFMYYLVAYAIAVRRIYQVENKLPEGFGVKSNGGLELQTA